MPWLKWRREPDSSKCISPMCMHASPSAITPGAVIAVVPHVSDKWYGPVAIEGDPQGGRGPDIADEEEGGRHRQPAEDPLPPTRMLSLEELFDLEAAAEEIEPEGDDADQTAENEN